MENSARQSSKLIPILIGVIGVGVLIAGGAFLALRGLRAASQESAEAMPIDTLAYASVDVVNLLDDEKVSRVTDAFGGMLDNADVEGRTREEILAQLDADLLSDLDMTFENDILPWVGRSVGFGITEMSVSAEDGLQTQDHIIAIEVRDEKDADAFLDKFVANYPNAPDGNPLSSADYEGVDYYVEASTGRFEQPLVIGRSDSLMLIASSQRTLQQAIDAQNGESLSDNANYSAILDALPAERAFAGYIDADAIRDIQSAVSEVLSPTVNNPLGETATMAGLNNLLGDDTLAAGMSVALVDEGIKFDFATHSAENDTEPTEITGAMADQLPADTYIYFNSGGLGHNWEARREALAEIAGGQDSYDDILLLAEGLLGFNPDDLLTQLTGELTIALTTAQDGLLQQMSDTSLGVILVNEANDPAAITGILNGANQAVENQLLFPVSTINGDGYIIHSIDNEGDSLFAYGLSGSQLLLGTSQATLDSLFADGDKLADSETFGEAQAAMPAGYALNLFVDQQGLASLSDTVGVDAGDSAENIRLIAAGTNNDGTTGQATLILFLEDVVTSE